MGDTSDKSVNFLYGSVFGRALQNAMIFCRVPAILGAVLRSPVSRIYINRFIKKNQIDMSDFNGVKFKSFNDFFTRKKEIKFDENPNHLISPCDGMISVYEINSEKTFHIKGFDYTVSDLIGGDDVASEFENGTCVVFRLRPIDYHRYCYIDSGVIGENHFIKGTLHSVQDAATSRYRVYTKNRRSWVLMETENFGKVIQVEVGAFSVGGIVNHHQNSKITKGDEKGFFDLHGSTIVMLFQKDRIKLLPQIIETCKGGNEFGIKAGNMIGEN